MTEDLEVEATGETVGEAKWLALRELERIQPALDKSAVTFQVISEGERGLLGVGYARGSRERRPAAWGAWAVRSAEGVIPTGEPVELEPMSPIERKVVHVRLQDFPGVETRSEGTEPSRYVVVAPAGA